MALYNKTETRSPLPQNHFKITQQPTKIKTSKQEKDDHFHESTSKVTHQPTKIKTLKPQKKKKKDNHPT